MIVEESETQRRTLADSVRLWGYDTETASDGLEALAKCHGSVQGRNLGPRDATHGRELLEVLRSRALAVECIIVTGYGTLEMVEETKALGAIDYLEKPLDLERLRADLQRLAPGDGASPPGSLLCNPALGILARISCNNYIFGAPLILGRIE